MHDGCYLAIASRPSANPRIIIRATRWTAAEELKQWQFLELADGKRAVIMLTWPVIRTDQPNIGRVCSNDYADGQEVHIVDFSHGANLWKYDRRWPERAPVQYHDGIQSGYSDEYIDIVFGERTPLTTRVYNIEVEGFHTYYVGELGVWVHNTDCSHLITVTTKYGKKAPNETRLFDSETELTKAIEKEGLQGLAARRMG